MKMIILAAGQGTRLRPLTNDQPKCMVSYNGKRIIDDILEVSKNFDFNKTAIVTGYKEEVLREYLKKESINFFSNASFDSTNMVSTLFCAKEFMDEDLIISYADIIYDKEVLEKLVNSTADFSVVVDKEWKALWQQRMENPLDDAETLKVKENKIIELGKKPNSYQEIEGQYIGLLKISKNALTKVISFYENLDKTALYDAKDFNNMYMTSFIQLIIDSLLDVTPIYIHGGWLEIDAIEDLKSHKVYITNDTKQ